MRPISTILHPVGQVSSVGDFGWSCYAARERRMFANLRGTVFGGSYAGASAWMVEQSSQARAFVLIFARAQGMEQFLSELPPQVSSIPMVGGAAARVSGAAFGFTHPLSEDIAVLAITEGEWRAVSIAAHFPDGDAFHCLGNDPRKFSAIQANGKTVGANDFLRKARAVRGLSLDDWDRLALITDDGIVLHLRGDRDTIVTGADLPLLRKVRLALFDQLRGREAILAKAKPGALAFGCAGLFGLFGVDRPWETTLPTTYLFGELTNVNGVPLFANLTFSILTPRLLSEEG